MAMPETLAFEYSCLLPGVAREQVWRRVGSWEGVNAELHPWFRMTFPPRFSRIEDIPADGQHHFTSTILLLGILPFDRHRFSLLGLDENHFFDERSSNFTVSVWKHKRMLEAEDGGVRVTDSCAFTPRISLMGKPLLAVYGAIFRRRHRRLAAYFAAAANA
jgi:ligand-binding SRPBCC domain-containing protein